VLSHVILVQSNDDFSGLTGGLIFMNLVFYIPEPFPAFLFFTVVSILSGGLCITCKLRGSMSEFRRLNNHLAVVGAACAEYRGFRRANKRKIASFPNNLSHATPTDQAYPMKGMSTNYSV
jgi:hypothetical protein